MNTDRGQELARPIFERIFQVRMRYIDTFTTDDIKIRGLPGSGHPTYDTVQQNGPVDLYLKICDMVGLFKQDVTFSLSNRSDAKEIYEIITPYLRYWVDLVTYTLHPLNVPLDDLVMLDTLNAKVYPFAHEGATGPIVVSKGLRKLSANLGLIALGGTTARTNAAEFGQYQSIIQNLSTLMHGKQHRIVE
jgi:hypothetical protein